MSTNPGAAPVRPTVTAEHLEQATKQTTLLFGAINGLLGVAHLGAHLGGEHPSRPRLGDDLKCYWQELGGLQLPTEKELPIWPQLLLLWFRDELFEQAGVICATAHEWVTEMSGRLRSTMSLAAADAAGVEPFGRYTASDDGSGEQYQDAFTLAWERKGQTPDLVLRVCRSLTVQPLYDGRRVWATLEAEHRNALKELATGAVLPNVQKPAVNDDLLPWPEKGWWVGKGQAAYDGKLFPISGRDRELLELFVRHAHNHVTVTAEQIKVHCGQKVRSDDSVKAEICRLNQCLRDQLGVSENPVQSVDRATWNLTDPVLTADR